MTTEYKKKIVLDDIALNLPEFEKQAHIKLFKRKHLLNTNTDHLELISDIIYSIIIKLDNEKSLNKYVKMVIDNKFKLYIFKAIDTNCTSFTAPFLFNKKNNNTYEITIDIPYNDEPSLDDDTRKLFEMSEQKQTVIYKIYDMFEPTRARELFGPYWKYLISLFQEYIDDPKASYASIGKKYDVSASSIGAHINLVKNIIKKELENENII